MARSRSRRGGFEAGHIDWIHTRIPLCSRLPATERAAHTAAVREFCRQFPLLGCAGLTVATEQAVVIAAQASLLTLHRPAPAFPTLRRILLYPGAFVVPVQEWSEDGMVVTEGRDVRIGEAGEDGTVVLSWEDIEADLADPGLAHNVVLHEFAHQLDLENGALDGTPRLPDARAYRNWASDLQQVYDQLCADADAGRETFLDPYACEHPAEFFAVVVEYFFEAATELAARHPRLYERLRDYFRQDPARWMR